MEDLWYKNKKKKSFQQN